MVVASQIKGKKQTRQKTKTSKTRKQVIKMISDMRSITETRAPASDYDINTDFPLRQLARRYNSVFTLPEYDMDTIAAIEYLLTNNSYTDRTLLQEHKYCLAALQKRLVTAAEEGDGATDLEFVVVRRRIASLIVELARVERTLPKQVVFKTASVSGAPSS